MIEYDDKYSGRVIEIDKISNITKPLFIVISKTSKIYRTEEKYVYFSKDPTLFLIYRSNVFFFFFLLIILVERAIE